MADIQWKKGMRVLVKYPHTKVCYLGTVTSVKSGFIYFTFDDGEKFKIKPISKSLLGVGVKRKRMKEIPLEDAENFLDPKFQDIEKPEKKEPTKKKETVKTIDVKLTDIEQGILNGLKKKQDENESVDKFLTVVQLKGDLEKLIGEKFKFNTVQWKESKSYHSVAYNPVYEFDKGKSFSFHIQERENPKNKEDKEEAKNDYVTLIKKALRNAKLKLGSPENKDYGTSSGGAYAYTSTEYHNEKDGVYLTVNTTTNKFDENNPYTCEFNIYLVVVYWRR